MKNFVCFALCFFIALNITLGRKRGKGDIRPRIFYGQETKIQEFPFVGYLKYGWTENCTHQLECGGVIIHKKWALTARHCWLEKGRNPVFVVGSTTTPENDGDSYHLGVARPVLRFYHHPNSFQTTNFLNPENGLSGYSFSHHDLTLMSFEDSLIWTQGIRPVRLDWGEARDAFFDISKPKRTYIGINVTFVGWGRTENSGDQASLNLNYFDSVTIDSKTCMDTGNHDLFTDDTFNICVKMTERHQTGCKADSGGPLLYVVKNYTWVIGIASYIGTLQKCGNSNTVFSRVDNSLPWIRETMHFCGDELYEWDPYLPAFDSSNIFDSVTLADPKKCNIKTQKEYEQSMTRTRIPQAENRPSFQMDAAELSKRHREARQRAIKRGSVMREEIRPVEPLPFH